MSTTNGGEEEDADSLTLSASTFAALNEFYQEQEERDRQREEILLAKDEDTSAAATIDYFSEDWQLSQFWYDDATAEVLARECLRAAGGEGGRVACVSCPTLFLALRKLCPQLGERARLFEFDKRFAKLGGQFVFYDYKSPLDIPRFVYMLVSYLLF